MTLTSELKGPNKFILLMIETIILFSEVLNFLILKLPEKMESRIIIVEP